ncbi:polynucleotide adenylyltransferase PcnB [Marinomonas agarivorans]|nr:polynucleotide adenylyltransferase PcnB [Marinomonas agarivorans]
MLTSFNSFILKVMRFLFLKNSDVTYPIIIKRSDHTLSRKNISPNAIKVLYRLKNAGFKGFLVGGCIRDHLINLSPKDFDVVTDATPEEVHKLFSNSRLIGRRFRLVHVTFGREIIEVSTFRANSENNTNNEVSHSEHGMILRDNSFGNIEQDAERRDFTFNTLYYNIEDFSIHDYCGGLEDIKNKQVRIIGDPETRYKEDPVRMLRAIRFAAKLQFELEANTKGPIKNLSHLLDHIPPARLFEEVLKLLGSGYGVQTYQLLRQYGLFRYLFPETDALISSNWNTENIIPEAFILQGLKNTDQRIAEGKSTAPYFLYALMLWPKVLFRHEEFMAQGLPATPALHQAASLVIDNQLAATAIPRRISTPMREIWDLQLRLPKRFGKRAYLLEQHPRFRAAFDFILVRESSGSNTGNLGSWWQAFQEGSDKQRRELINSVDKFPVDRHSGPKRRPKRKRYNKNTKASPQSQTGNDNA